MNIYYAHLQEVNNLTFANQTINGWFASISGFKTDSENPTQIHQFAPILRKTKNAAIEDLKTELENLKNEVVYYNNVVIENLEQFINDLKNSLL